MDRDETLRRAEKLLRQGRLDTAIEEYASVVEAYPKDWATGNLLGDLFIRAGRTDRAVAQYSRIAEQLASEGFLSKAGALYKKIIKITPDDEKALLRTAELSSQQGLLADARHVLHTLFQRRVKAGDRDGAAGVAKRLADLDPNDVVGRLDAARMLAEIGDPSGAADHLRLAGDTLADQGREADALRAWREAMRLNPANTLAQERVTSGLLRQGDLDGALASAQSVAERRVIAQAMLKAGRAEAGLALLGQVLEADPDHVDTRLQLARLLMAGQQYSRACDLLKSGLQSGDARIELALAESELRSGMTSDAVTTLRHLLETDAANVDHVAALGASLVAEQPDTAFVAIECALDHISGLDDIDRAMKIVERFVTAVPRHVSALERYAQLCRDGHYADTLYLVESELTEAYLTHRRFAEALPLAERLAELRPDVDRHQEQAREARAGIGASTASVPEESDPGPSTNESIDLAGFIASLGLPVHRDVAMEEGDPVDVPPIVAAAGREPPPADEVVEIELADALDALAARDASGTIVEGIESLAGPFREQTDSAGELDGLFRQMREESGRGQAEADAMRAYDEAGVHYNEGRFDQAVTCLRRAGRDVSLRFRAAVMLARIATDRGQLDEAIAWLERASVSPAPSAQAERSLLYELASSLERAHEPARAQAVFLELNAMEPGYRDVAARLAALGDGGAAWLPES